MSKKGQAPIVPEDTEDCSCFIQARSADKFPCVTKNVTHPLRYYEFTQDEIRVLEECDKESFYQRCLPLSTLFAGITYAAIRNGWLKRNPHFGAIPKLLTAAIFGHVYGRVSYIPTCDDKIRHLDDKSHLGNVMRLYYEKRCGEDPNKKGAKKGSKKN